MCVCKRQGLCLMTDFCNYARLILIECLYQNTSESTTTATTETSSSCNNISAMLQCCNVRRFTQSDCKYCMKRSRDCGRIQSVHGMQSKSPGPSQWQFTQEEKQLARSPSVAVHTRGETNRQVSLSGSSHKRRNNWPGLPQWQFTQEEKQLARSPSVAVHTRGETIGQVSLSGSSHKRRNNWP
jgi:hypothetical protein